MAGVKVEHGVELLAEAALRHDHFDNVREILLESFQAGAAFVASLTRATRITERAKRKGQAMVKPGPEQRRPRMWGRGLDDVGPAFESPH